MPDFAIWPDCNIGCVFCSNPVEGFRGTSEKYSFAEIEKKILEYKAGRRRFLKFDAADDYFTLTGGEPTLNPDFARIVGLIRREFPVSPVRLLTNGRLFESKDFCRAVFRLAGPGFEAAIPVFGPDSKSYEAISRAPGSFKSAMAGLGNALAARGDGQKVEVRLILTRIQMKSLGGILDMLWKEFPEIDRVCFLFVELEGFAEKYRSSLSMTMTECADGLEAVWPKAERFREARLYHFPLCVLPGRLRPFARKTLSEIKVDSSHPECSRCAARSDCVGVHGSYRRWMGAPDIEAISAEAVQ